MPTHRSAVRSGWGPNAFLAASLGAACALSGRVARAQDGPLPLALAATRIDAAAAVDAETARLLARVEAETSRSSRAEAEIAGLARRRTEASARLRARARALYRLTRAGMLPLAGGFEAMVGHVARLDRLRRMVKQDAGAVRTLRARGESLRSEIAEAAEALAVARAGLRALESRRQQAAVPVWSDVGFSLAESVSSPSGAPALPYGSLRVVDGVDDLASGGFAALRGALGVPVSGAVRLEPSPSGDGGLQLVVAPGAAVRAAAAGRVAFAASQPGYGRLVIVDHGENHYTVYGALDAIEVRVGDAVERGTRVGGAGSAPVRFEVRRGTRTLDARSWLGL